MSISCSWLIIRELWQFILFSLFVSLPHRLQASSFSLIATLNPLLGFPNLPHPGGVVYGSISSKSLQNLPLPLHLCCSFLTSFSPPFLELAHINGFLFALSPIFYTSFFPVSSSQQLILWDKWFLTCYSVSPWNALCRWDNVTSRSVSTSGVNNDNNRNNYHCHLLSFYFWLGSVLGTSQTFLT